MTPFMQTAIRQSMEIAFALQTDDAPSARSLMVPSLEYQVP